MISPEAEKRYLETQGCACPYCGSRNIESEDIDWDTPLGIRVRCDDCNKLWVEIHTITAISEISD